MSSRREKKGINLPGVLLDSIRDKEEKGEYDDSSRFRSQGLKRNRNEKFQSRKEKRQEERKQKKHKKAAKHQAANNGSSKPTNAKTSSKEDPIEQLRQLKKSKNTQDKGLRIIKADEIEDDDSMSDFGDSFDDGEDEEDPMEALRRLKKNKVSTELKIVKEEDLQDDSDVSLDSQSDGGDEINDSNGSSKSNLRVLKEDELEDDEVSDLGSDFGSDSEGNEDLGDEDLEEEEDPMEALRKLKAKKNQPKQTEKPEENESEDSFGGFDDFDDLDEDKDLGELEYDDDPISQLKKLKEKKKSHGDKKKKTKKPEHDIDPATFDAFQKDDEDIEFYAKKLGLKNGKKSKLTKMDEDDDIGGLLDGLDMDFSDVEEQGASELDYEDAPLSDDNDQEASGSTKEHDSMPFGSDDSLSEGDFDTDSEEEVDDFDANTVPTNENPYVAPVKEDSEAKFVPPALRRKLAMESQGLSPEVIQLQKSIKGGLNKLSEANVASIVNDINSLYLNNARQVVHENITNIVIDSVIKQGRLLETFGHLHACLVTALYRLQGPEFGAHFIQTLVEKFLKSQEELGSNTEALNMISLLSSVYLFQLVSSSLLYDLIKDFLKNFNERNAELLLKLIRTAGNQMRSDDPGALKEIILLTNEISSSMSNVNTRTQFLIETITSLKNNKLKVTSESSFELVVRLRKFLGGLSSNKFSEAIQVTLDDIKNVETKGKWWLIGSAWKGNESEDINNYDKNAMDEILDSAEPNWMQIAKEQRMNTDIRRAIFISIMSAEDYIDALTKLDKLSLKKAQEREIPRILIHCVSVEPSWNPYYGLIAHKLCESHSYRKTFQFMFWDILKEFEGNGEGEDEFTGFSEDQDDSFKLKRTYNLGKLFGYLIAEGSLPLHVLRNVNFLVASSDTKLLLEIILTTFLDLIAKKSQLNSVGTGLVKTKNSEVKFHDQLLIERVVKAQKELGLLRGLQFFVQDKVMKSNFVNSKRQKQRVEWGSNAMFDIIDQLLQRNE